MVLFYVKECPFSQWSGHGFIDDNGTYYQTAEHYMMAKKAVLMGASSRVDEILRSDTPMAAKEIGRALRGDLNRWNASKRDIVYDGNMLKFKQNPDILKLILSTGNKTLVEASPRDRVWGVGFDHYEAPRNVFKWGDNWLGEALMRVRTQLRVEGYHAT